MAEAKEKFCNVCAALQVRKQVGHWCVECEEGLCGECLKHHTASIYTRSHEIITIASYMSLPTHHADIVQYCKKHCKRCNFHCSEHEFLCCTDCISQSHSRSSGISGLNEVVKSEKSSTILTDIERGLRNIKSNIDKISQEKKQNLYRISTQRQQICNEIKSFRKKINLQLDTMENQLMRDLNAAEKTINSKIEYVLLELNKREKSAQKLQDDARASVQYDTKIQSFFVSKSLKKSIETEEMYFKSLFDGTMLQQYDLGLVINNQVSEFDSFVKSLGTITYSERPTTVTFHTEKENEDQIISHPREQSLKSIHDINVTLIRKFEMSGFQSEDRFITSCAVNNEGKIVLADYQNDCLVILNNEGKVEGEISTKPSLPWDVTCFDDSRVAVTCQYPNKIFLVNIISKTIEKMIESKNLFSGIQHIDGSLSYYEYTIGLHTYNLTTSASTVVVKTDTYPSYPRYVALSGSRIYLTEFDTDSIFCYFDTGKKIWEYFNKEVLKEPCSVAVDKNSNVYVASFIDASVVVISYDGKRGRKLINLDTKLRAIHIDKNDRLLAVDCRGNLTVTI